MAAFQYFPIAMLNSVQFPGGTGQIETWIRNLNRLKDTNSPGAM